MLVKCKVCDGEYQRQRLGQKACSPECAIQYARSIAAKKKRKQDHDRLQGLKSIGDLRREAQTAFNQYIRLRDMHRGCISCGTRNAGQYHAGHYRTRAAAPQLAYNCLNTWGQCAQCNHFLSGNITAYRIELIKRIGIDRVERLESDQGTSSKDPAYYLRLKRLFARRARHLARLRALRATVSGAVEF